jgi:hypothetical protein
MEMKKKTKTSDVVPVSQEKKCLLCGRSDLRIKRGLCVNHFEEFRRTKRSIPADLRAGFDQEMVDDQMIEANTKRGRPKSTGNKFAKKAVEFLKKTLPADRQDAIVGIERAINQSDQKKK